MPKTRAAARETGWMGRAKACRRTGGGLPKMAPFRRASRRPTLQNSALDGAEVAAATTGAPDVDGEGEGSSRGRVDRLEEERQPSANSVTLDVSDAE